MLKKTLIALAAILIVFLAFVATQPADFRIERSATINAPQDLTFAHVNDFHKWQEWSPWAKLDPSATATFSGPTAGKGAQFSWAGNSEVGKGTMTILESQPPEQIQINLEFTEPMAATNLTEFTFQGEGEQTVVTWAMSGKHDFLGKMFCLVMDMDTMVGADFEKGLASMKTLVESANMSTAAGAEG